MKSDKPFTTDYYGVHEAVYQKLKESGYDGWGSEDHTQRINETFEMVFEVLKKHSIQLSGKLLDLGCGDGGLSLLFGAAGFEIYGIDISPTAIQWAKHKAKERNIKAEFSVGSVLKLGYPPDYFDVIIDSACSHCIIGNDRKIYFKGIITALKYDGLYILTGLCGDPAEEQTMKDFDPQTRCLIRNGIAGRYYGKPEDILEEIREPGFSVHDWHIHCDPQTNQPELFLIAGKREFV